MPIRRGEEKPSAFSAVPVPVSCWQPAASGWGRSGGRVHRGSAQGAGTAERAGERWPAAARAWCAQRPPVPRRLSGMRRGASCLDGTPCRSLFQPDRSIYAYFASRTSRWRISPSSVFQRSSLPVRSRYPCQEPSFGIEMLPGLQQRTPLLSRFQSGTWVWP